MNAPAGPSSGAGEVPPLSIESDSKALVLRNKRNPKKTLTAGEVVLKMPALKSFSK